jgi:hypothetical protein
VTHLYRQFSATIYVENEDRNLKLYWLSPFVLLHHGSFRVQQIETQIENMSV